MTTEKKIEIMKPIKEFAENSEYMDSAKTYDIIVKYLMKQVYRSHCLGRYMPQYDGVRIYNELNEDTGDYTLVSEAVACIADICGSAVDLTEIDISRTPVIIKDNMYVTFEYLRINRNDLIEKEEGRLRNEQKAGKKVS